MLEHVRSRVGPLAVMLDLMTPIVRGFGADLNRDTVRNVERAASGLRAKKNAYLDMVKIMEAN